MKKEVKHKRKLKEVCCVGGSNACGGGVYGLGFIGATVYYISTATSFGAGIIGILKAIIWPAFLIFEIFKFLGM